MNLQREGLLPAPERGANGYPNYEGDADAGTVPHPGPSRGHQARAEPTPVNRDVQVG